MNLTLDTTIGIFGLVVGIVSLLATFFMRKKYSARKTVFFRDKAVQKYKSLESMLVSAKLLEDNEFGGGANKIIPQLQMEGVDAFRIEESPELKGFKRTVRYIYHTEDGKRWEKCWGIS